MLVGGSESTARKEFLKMSFVQKGDFRKARGAGPVGRENGPGVVPGNWLYAVELGPMKSRESFFLFFFNFFFKFIFERDRDRGAERERETQKQKQVPGSELSVQSPTRGLDAGLELMNREIMT